MSADKDRSAAILGALPLLHFQTHIVQIRKALLFWYKTKKLDYPWRRIWREHRDPYVVWVSEVMLQQTQISSVLKKYESFLGCYPNLSTLARAKEEDLRLEVRGLGYYRRFANLLKGAQLIENERKGAWPQTYEQWLEIPGVGDYIASAVASIAFSQACAVVDGNVERVLCRLLDMQISPNISGGKKVFKALMTELLSIESPGDFNQAVMELGQRLCLKQNPLCQECMLNSWCLSFNRGTTKLSPKPKIRREVEEVKLALYIDRDSKGRIALRQRKNTAKFFKGSLGFDLEVLEKPKKLISIGSFMHQITHHRIAVQVFLRKAKNSEGEWFFIKEIEKKISNSLELKAWILFQTYLAKQKA